MNNLHNNPHCELPPLQPQQVQRIYQQRQLEYEAQQRQHEEQRRYQEQQHQLEEHQRQLQQQQRQLEYNAQRRQYEEQRQLQQQQGQYNIASVYPKLPSQEELPSYSAASSPIMSMPQPPSLQQQCTSSPQVQHSQYPQQSQLQPQLRPPVMFYGSIAPPNVSTPSVPGQENHTVQSVGSLRTKSELVQCPHCQQLVYTVLDYDSGLCTGLSVGGLFMAGCHSGGCLLPFLFPWTKDVSHHCPSCKEKIATFTRLERDTRVTGPPLGL